MSDLLAPELVPHLRLAGTPESIGEQHGELLRASIRELAEVRIDYLNGTSGQGNPSVVERVARAMGDAIQQTLPLVYRETAATARAAGIPYWKLVVAGAVSDVADVAARGHSGSPFALEECTIIVLRRPSGVVIAGTWDTHGAATRHLAVCERHPIGQPATIALTTAGWPMQQVVTACGLGATVANVVARSTATGAPFIAVLPAIARQQHLNEAAAVPASVPHCSGRFYIIADRTSALGIELVPPACLFREDRLPITHTNHYIFDGADVHEGRPGSLDSSARRLTIARTIAASHDDASAPTLVMALARSEAKQNGLGDADRTGAIFALVPAEGMIAFTTSAANDVMQLNLRTEMTECQAS